MLIGMHAAVALHLEGLAAVLRPIQGNAKDVDDLFIRRIDPNLGEVHRSWIEAIHPGPGLAAVGGPVDAAGLKAFGALLVLDILALAAQGTAIGTRRVTLGSPLANAFEATGDEWDRKVQFLLAAGDGELDLLAGLVAAGDGSERLEETLHRLSVDGCDQ